MGGYLSHLEAEKSGEVLNASCGPISGNVYDIDSTKVDGYLGIPYAQPPIGDLRFKKPVAIEKWAEPLSCHKYGPGCPQSGPFAAFLPKNTAMFSEDNCLTLSVFGLRSKESEFVETGYPVIVYFYGGGFEVGNSAMVHDYSLAGTLVRKGVVVVLVNYRVGPLGFLTTGDDVAKGNFGLWDQTLALEWVQQHIRSFDGNPENVTIAGSSAGAASTDLLALSPHSNKLFHRLIAMSGSAYCDFAIRTKATQANVFLDFAKFHGYSGSTSEELLAWYKQAPLEKFKEVAGWKNPASGFLGFVPNFDGDFFPAPFEELRRKAPKLDAIFTVGEYEGLGMAAHDPLFKDSKSNFKTIIAQYYGPDITDDFVDAQEKLFEAYTKDLKEDDTAGYTKKAIEFLGDSLFNIGALEAASSCARHGNTAYLASFNYFCADNQDPIIALYPFKASSHCSEFRYVFGANMIGTFSPTEEEKKIMDMMGDFVTNFAKYGNPNGQTSHNDDASSGKYGYWEKFNSSHEYFKIDNPPCEMSGNFQNGRLEIYKKINESGKKYQEIIIGKKL